MNGGSQESKTPSASQKSFGTVSVLAIALLGASFWIRFASDTTDPEPTAPDETNSADPPRDRPAPEITADRDEVAVQQTGSPAPVDSAQNDLTSNSSGIRQTFDPSSAEHAAELYHLMAGSDRIDTSSMTESELEWLTDRSASLVNEMAKPRYGSDKIEQYRVARAEFIAQGRYQIDRRQSEESNSAWSNRVYQRYGQPYRPHGTNKDQHTAYQWNQDEVLVVQFTNSDWPHFQKLDAEVRQVITDFTADVEGRLARHIHQEKRRNAQNGNK